jgi:hypothetical protein
LRDSYNKQNVDAFLSRTGTKITSINDEMETIRQLGIASNGAREYVSLFSNDGTILHTQEGIEPGVVSLTKEAIDMLNSTKDNSVIMLHNHASNVGFSGADIQLMCDYKSIEKIGAICHNGDNYFLSIGNGIRPFGYIVKEKYDRYITNRVLDAVFEDVNMSEKEIVQSAMRAVVKKYNWHLS